MHRRMTTCPECGWEVYGDRIRYIDSIIEVDCPRCGLQEKSRIIQNDMSFLSSFQKKCSHGMPIGCCAVCISELKAKDIGVPYERDPWD